MDARKKKALAWSAAAAGAAAATYGLVIRPWHHKWGAAPIDVKRPMPGDDIVAEPNDITNRAVTIEAEPEDIWPALIRREGQPLREEDVISIGAAGDLRVVEVRDQRSVVLVPDGFAHGRASWSIMLTQFAPNRTRLVCRTRLRFGWSPNELLYRLALDPAAFLMFRKWFADVKRQAEHASSVRREHKRVERRSKPQREYRPRQQNRGGQLPLT